MRRIGTMVAWLGFCLPCSLTNRALRRDDPWPPRFLAGIARIAGVRILVQGVPCATRSLILANHVSWIDVPALAALTDAAFIAHDGLASVPIVRSLCHLNHTIFVARGHRATVGAQVVQMRAGIAARCTIALFPEGTTSDGAALLPFKSALLAALDPVPEGLAIQPVWLDYGPEVAATAWVGNEPGLRNFLRIVARRQHVALTLHFLPMLSGADLAGRKPMAAAARAAIVAAMAGGRTIQAGS